MGWWVLGLLLCLYGCGDVTTELPRSTGADTIGHGMVTQLDKSRSSQSASAIMPVPSTSFPESLSMPFSASTTSAAVSSLRGQGPATLSVDKKASWQQWDATARESPDRAIRLQVLETWAQQPVGELNRSMTSS